VTSRPREKRKRKKAINLCSMYLFDECMYSPTSVNNKNKLVPKGKTGQAFSKEVKF